MFGKRSQAGGSPSDRAGAPAASRADVTGQPLADRGTPTAGVGGLLAGRVIDSSSSRSPTAFIQVVPLTGDKEDTPTAGSRETPAAPIEVATDQQGYFTIQGLQPGQHYKLVARARDGERKMAGITYATPPDPKIVIQISEDFVSPATPDIPPEPTFPGSKAPGGGPRAAPKQPPATLDRPSAIVPGSGPAQLGQPAPGSGAAATQPAAVPPSHPENIVDKGDKVAKSLAEIQNPWQRPAGQTQVDQPAAASATFCKLANNRLEDFMLNDLDGQPWQFQRTPHGRLVLLDFWGTWCPHCVEAIPHLVSMQTRYHSFGLDVVGVTYELEGTPEEQSRKVKGLRDRMGVNYHLLLASDAKACPVKSQFRIEAFPTLILLDEQGHILWRNEGLDRAKLLELEGLIRWQLRLR
jgi:thiol-disulfide isomerase/thioredoxin